MPVTSIAILRYGGRTRLAKMGKRRRGVCDDAVIDAVDGYTNTSAEVI